MSVSMSISLSIFVSMSLSMSMSVSASVSVSVSVFMSLSLAVSVNFATVGAIYIGAGKSIGAIWALPEPLLPRDLSQAGGQSGGWGPVGLAPR